MSANWEPNRVLRRIVALCAIVLGLWFGVLWYSGRNEWEPIDRGGVTGDHLDPSVGTGLGEAGFVGSESAVKRVVLAGLNRGEDGESLGHGDQRIGFGVAIRVVDVSGGGIDKAVVTEVNHESALVLTASDGWAFLDVSVGAASLFDCEIRVRRGGYAEKRVAVRVDLKKKECVLVSVQMEKAPVLLGRVVDAYGAIFPGAYVELSEEKEAARVGELGIHSKLDWGTNADRNGLFVFTDLSESLSYELKARKIGSLQVKRENGWGRMSGITVAKAKVQAIVQVGLPSVQGPVLDSDLIGMIHGVVNWESGGEVKHAVVYYRPESGGEYRQVTADDQGHFVILAVRKGETYELVATSGSKEESGRAQVDVQTGQLAVLELPRYPILKIGVFDEAGAPLTDFTVREVKQDPGVRGRRKVIASYGAQFGSNIAFVTQLPGASILEVSARGYKMHRLPLPLSVDSNGQIDISLEKAFRLSGAIVGLSPKTDEILIQWLKLEAGAEPPMAMPWNFPGSGASVQKLRRPWEFEFFVQDPGEYAIGVFGDGLPTSRFFPFKVAADAKSSGLVIKMDRAGAVVGHVTGASDDVILGLTVMIGASLDNVLGEAMLDGERGFSFDAVPSGEWNVWVEGPGGFPAAPPKHIRISSGNLCSVRFDLDIPSPVVVQGELLFSGQSFQDQIEVRYGPLVEVLRNDWVASVFVREGESVRWLGSSKVDGKGGFRVEGIPEPGMFLKLVGGVGLRSKMELTRVLSRQYDRKPLLIDLDFGSVVVASRRMDRSTMKKVELRWGSLSEGDLWGTIRDPFVSSRELGFALVPSGNVRLVIPDADLNSTNVEHEFVLAGGKVLRLTL